MPPDTPAREREWEKHKTRIWHLLQHQKLRPEELRDRMRALGFIATYVHALHLTGVVLYVPSVEHVNDLRIYGKSSPFREDLETSSKSLS